MKTCSKCGAVKLLAEFYHEGRDAACKACANKRSIEWAKTNPARVRESKKRNWKTRTKRFEEAARYRKKYPERIRLGKARAYASRRDHYIAKSKEWQRTHGYVHQNSAAYRQVHALGNSYIKAKLTRGTRLKYKDIPDSVVELKRVLILIHRHKKQQTPGEYGNAKKHQRTP